MFILKKIFKSHFLLALTFLTVHLLVSGYGYMGNLPELGEKTKINKAGEFNTNNIKSDEETVTNFKPSSILVPRPDAGHKINKYSNYLDDVYEINNLLKEIKGILARNNPEKTQLFCAKVNVLNLYVDNLKKKYTNRPERHYQSYKQLVILNKYLTEIVTYKQGMDRYSSINRGTLASRINDENYLKQKIKKTIIPINTVINIIEEAG